jgi:hypothetical protein
VAQEEPQKITEIDRARRVVPPASSIHTHPAFINSRLVDFENESLGQFYEEIARPARHLRSVKAVGAGRAPTEKILQAPSNGRELPRSKPSLAMV